MAKWIAQPMTGPADAAVWEALRFMHLDRRVVERPGDDAVRLVDERHRLDAAMLAPGERVERLAEFAVEVLGAPLSAVQAHLARARERAARRAGTTSSGREALRRRLTLDARDEDR